MHEIIIVTNNRERFASFAEGLLAGSDCTIDWAGSAEETMAGASGRPFGVMVIDENVDGMSNLQLARQIVMTSPMMNLVLVSALSPEDFHEASEGLGILAQLPPHPGPEDASMLLEAIKRVSSFADVTPHV